MGDKSPGVKRVNCKIKNDQEASKNGIFIGVWMMNKFKGDVEKIRAGFKNSWFEGLLRNDLKKFLRTSNQTISDIEEKFNVSIGIYQGFRIRNKTFYHGKIIRYPKTFDNSVWFDYIVETKRNNSKGVEYQLLCNFDIKNLLSVNENKRNITSNSTQKDIKIPNLSNLIFLLTGQNKDIDDLNMRNISYVESRWNLNIILLEPDASDKTGKKIVRKKPIQAQKTTVHLLVERGASQELLKPIKDFTLISIKSGIPETFVCSINPQCKYKTSVKANFLRHESKCEKISQKIITCKQKAYGDDSSILTQMVRFNLYLKLNNFKLRRKALTMKI